MPPKPTPRLTRVEIRKTLKRHRGSVVSLAAELSIKPQTVSIWLKGRMTSKRIADAAQAKAISLLELEGKNAA